MKPRKKAVYKACMRLTGAKTACIIGKDFYIVRNGANEDCRGEAGAHKLRFLCGRGLF